MKNSNALFVANTISVSCKPFLSQRVCIPVSSCSFQTIVGLRSSFICAMSDWSNKSYIVIDLTVH